MEVKKKKLHTARKIISGLCLIALSGVLFLAAYVFGLDAWHEFDADKILKAPQSLIIYDSNGDEAYAISGKENRIWVKIDDIPKHVQNAFIAVEDTRFYDHNGIDIIRIAGAAIADIKSGGYVQGASTITQQLIKLSHLTSEKTMNRKIEEAVLAYQMEKQFSKEEILEMYINYVYYGGGFYGIESAARGYFGKNTNELTLSEGAMLAGILKSPSNYAPHLDLEESTERRNKVLDLMVDYGCITESECNLAKNDTPTILYDGKKESELDYYSEQVIKEASEILKISKDELINGGYRIHTFLDSQIQNNCESIFNDNENFPTASVQSAIAVVDVHTGGICAMIGGRGEYSVGAYNRAIDLRRQPGSVIKPIIAYAPALEYKGYTAATVLKDEPMTFGNYTPKNYGDKYYGNVTLRRAISGSLNIPAVTVLNDIGVDMGKRFAGKLGIEFTESDNSLALALGGFTYGVSPVQIAGAYSAFADGGKYTENFTVHSITGNGVNFTRDTEKKRVMSEGNAAVLTNMLESVVEEGTGHRLGEHGIKLAGKTGTVAEPNSEGNRDAWMVAYNEEYSVAVWIGYDSNRDGVMDKSSTGGNFPAKIIGKLFDELYADKQPPEFVIPDDVIKVRIDSYSIQNDAVAVLATPFTPQDSSFYEFFVKGTEPKIGGEYWSIPTPPHDITCHLSPNGSIIISFTPLNDYTIYSLYRESADGEAILLEQTSGSIEKFVFEDTIDSLNTVFYYYVIPEHPEMKVNGEPVCGATSQRIPIIIVSG